MCERPPYLAAVLALALIFLPATIRAQSASIQASLQNKYKDKILILRGFPTGKSLSYEASGTPLGDPHPGQWTLDAFVRINSVTFDGQDLVLAGVRMVVGSQGKGFYFLTENSKKYKKEFGVEIHAKVGPVVSQEQILALMDKIFLTDRDSLLSFVPSYWQTCASAGLNEVNDPKYTACRFSAEMLAIPGVNAHADLRVLDQAHQTDSSQPGVVRHRGGVSPPRAISQPEPQFSDASRDLNWQGVVTMMLIVDENGNPGNIEILYPLGAGLDDEAVRAVSKWKFKPAQEEGHVPVAVQIAVQVDFHF